MPRQADGWPVAFSAEVKALVVIRHQLVPGAGGPPVCCVCGLPIYGRPDFHHRARRVPGDGRPENCLPVHNRLEAGMCHFTRIHEDVAVARDAGWILRVSGPVIAYAAPVRLNCAVPGFPAARWVVLDDAGTMRDALPAEVGGGYEP